MAIIQVDVLVGTSSQELEDFVGAKFYCMHTIADSNQSIQIREKTLEFSSTVLSATILYLLPTAWPQVVTQFLTNMRVMSP